MSELRIFFLLERVICSANVEQHTQLIVKGGDHIFCFLEVEHVNLLIGK